MVTLLTKMERMVVTKSLFGESGEHNAVLNAYPNSLDQKSTLLRMPTTMTKFRRAVVQSPIRVRQYLKEPF